MKVKLWKNQRGVSPVKKYIEKLDSKTRAKIDKKIERFYKYKPDQLIRSRFIKKLHGYDLHQLSINSNKQWIRILLTVIGATYWLLHCFKKKTNSTPKKEINKALRRKKEL